jgi:hypothetical protein
VIVKSSKPINSYKTITFKTDNIINKSLICETQMNP